MSESLGVSAHSFFAVLLTATQKGALHSGAPFYNGVE